MEDPLKTFRLNTLTYDTKPASFIATRCLQELAIQNANQFPEAAKIIQNHFYVDDLLTGDDSLEKLIMLRDQVVKILNQGGLVLRKWASNHPALIPNTHGGKESDLNVRLDKNTFTKTLGLLWNPGCDSLKYEVKTIQIPKQVTRRDILSKTAQVFDPLGLVAPVIVKAKVILQHCWTLKIGWDDTVPANIFRAWTQLLQELYHIHEISIPRYIMQVNATNIQLHGFSDASQVAYGAALYLIITNNEGKHQTHLICAKSRVAPLKTVSLPRLELCAALLLARLGSVVIKALDITIHKTFLWTDSTITFAWINSLSANLQTFVGNRVAEIQTLTTVNEWHHVRSESNPADVLSRGALPGELKGHPLWWHGPAWLSQTSEQWPLFDIN